MKIDLDSLQNLQLTECEIKSPLDLHVHGAHDYSWLKGVWFALLRRPTARPLTITNCNFHNSSYMPRWRDRLAAAWRCLFGYVPSNADCLTIHHDA